MMECWNNGGLAIDRMIRFWPNKGRKNMNCFDLSLTQYSIIPLFQHSWGAFKRGSRWV